ncbi:MAG: HAMP domain-containing sensor histidine kinase [Dysgonamonadaceae bacterium]
MKKLSLQNRIAVNVIVCSTLLTMVLCLVILIVFKLHSDRLSTETEITMDDVQYLFMILLRVCCIGVFFTLLLLFAISRKIAYNTTKPIREIINIANTITHNNLSARIPLPSHKDELYELSETINNLLDRIEYAVEREKSFTSYASHEFRTPLSVLKGTMEVLIRKPRSEAEYKEKIGFCIKEVDKLNEMVEQLLILTRYEERKCSLNYDNHSLEDMVNNSVCLYCDAILNKQLEVKTSFSPQGISVCTDENSFSTILNNLISNAVKYSNEKGIVEIKAEQIENQLILKISNTGKGIPKEEMDAIFEKFYRSYAAEQPNVKGFGLGLPIVKRFCSLLDINIEISSVLNKNTTVKLTIPLEK